MLEGQDSTNEESGELEFPKNELDTEDTIATKDFNTSTVHLNLKIIREEKKTSKSKKQSIELEAEESHVPLVEDSTKLPAIKEVFVARSREETSEERKQRKQQVKEFKKQRTEKKRQFKNEFKEKVQLKSKEINATQKAENKKGIAIVKL